MGFLSTSPKPGLITGFLFSPEREIKKVEIEVDTPMLTWRNKGGNPMSWILQRPVRSLLNVGPYVLLRPDRLEPLAPDSDNTVTGELLTRAFNKRHAEVTQTPLQNALGSILMFDMILMGLAVVFGLFICIMLFPQVVEMLNFGD